MDKQGKFLAIEKHVLEMETSNTKSREEVYHPLMDYDNFRKYFVKIPTCIDRVKKVNDLIESLKHDVLSNKLDNEIFKKIGYLLRETKQTLSEGDQRWSTIESYLDESNASLGDFINHIILWLEGRLIQTVFYLDIALVETELTDMMKEINILGLATIDSQRYKHSGKGEIQRPYLAGIIYYEDGLILANALYNLGYICMVKKLKKNAKRGKNIICVTYDDDDCFSSASISGGSLVMGVLPSSIDNNIGGSVVSIEIIYPNFKDGPQSNRLFEDVLRILNKMRNTSFEDFPDRSQIIGDDFEIKN